LSSAVSARHQKLKKKLIVSHVVGFTPKLQEQDVDGAGNFSVCKASNSFVSRSSQLIIEQIMRGFRLK
jgi:hypothetical protein